jgi:hypothetical protein
MPGDQWNRSRRTDLGLDSLPSRPSWPVHGRFSAARSTIERLFCRLFRTKTRLTKCRRGCKRLDAEPQIVPLKATRDADLQALLEAGATGLEPATDRPTFRRPLGPQVGVCPTGERDAKCWGRCWGTPGAHQKCAANRWVLAERGDWIAPRRSPVRVRLAPS